MSFWSELKRRNVVKVALAYLVASWLIVQIIGALTNPLGLPETLATVVIVLLAIGFPFALIVAWIYEVTPEGIKVTSPADASAQAPRPTGARLTYVIIGLLMVSVALMAYQSFFSATPREGFGEGSRLAVLPCDDLSPDPSDEFFAVGIHEELLNRLAALHELNVISRTSVLRYADNRPPLRQIARELDVHAIIECSARYSGDRVLLTVQLIDAASDTHLWSDTFPADMSNLRSVFEIQADIAMEVADNLRVEFLEEELEQIERVPTESREAYELYLASVEAAAYDRKLALVDQALALDDQFVDAWIQKSFILAVLAGFTTGEEASAQRAGAIEASRAAVRSDPGSGRAQASLAGNLAQVGDWIGSELAVRRARELGAPGENPMAKLAVAHTAEAVAMLERIVELNPSDTFAPGFLLLAYESLGNTAERRRHWERGELIFEGRWFGAELEPTLRLGDNDLEYIRTQGPMGPVWNAGRANLESPGEGIAALQSLHANNPALRSANELRNFAAWAAYFGDPKQSLEWLREAIELQATSVMGVWTPLFKDVRQEPGFKDLLRGVGIVEYWNRFGWPDRCRQIGSDDFECD